MRPKSGSVAQIAARQHGVITLPQLLAVGMSREAVKRWAKDGRLHRVHRGVYRVGHTAPSTEATYLAAVLACGEGAAASGMAAAWIYALVHRPPPPEVSTTRNRKVPGVIVHRPRAIETTRWRGIPVTTLPRTLEDLAPRLPLDDLARICHKAEVIHGTTLGSPKHAKLKAIYEGDHALLLSRLEREFRDRLGEHSLPLPRTNKRLDHRYVDCRWPDHALTVELNSFTYHRSRHAWEEDYDRERAARARGDEFRRYTWRDVVEDPAPMFVDLQSLLVGTVTA